jgi:AraC-like DNA-binding protein
MKFDLIQIISAIAICQSLLLAIFFIILKKGMRLSNILFAFLMVIFSILIFCSLILSGEIPTFKLDFIKIIVMCAQLAFLVGPLFYLYLKALLDPKYSFKKQELIHVVPFLVFFAFFLYNVLFCYELYVWHAHVRIFKSSAVLCQNLFYLFLSVYTIRKSGIAIPQSLFKMSNDSRINWILILIIGFVIFWLIDLHSFIVLEAGRYYSKCPYKHSLYFISFFVFQNFVLLVILKKAELFTKLNFSENGKLNDAIKKRYLKKFMRYMDANEPYLDSDISQETIARELNIPIKYLSILITKSYGQNFRDFINSHRIKKSKALFNDSHLNGNKTILEIAYSVGFNSKSTFNSAFKKFTGLTPTKYRKLSK